VSPLGLKEFPVRPSPTKIPPAGETVNVTGASNGQKLFVGVEINATIPEVQ